MSAGDDNPRTLVAQALDLVVFAPLGLALDCTRVVPELAASGRRQVAFSKSLGRAALSTIARAATGPSVTDRSPSAGAATTVSSEPATAPSGVAGYDDMTARSIIELAQRSSASTRGWMLSRERAGKRRVTVLRELERTPTP